MFGFLVLLALASSVTCQQQYARNDGEYGQRIPVTVPAGLPQSSRRLYVSAAANGYDKDEDNGLDVSQSIPVGYNTRSGFTPLGQGRSGGGGTVSSRQPEDSAQLDSQASAYNVAPPQQNDFSNYAPLPQQNGFSNYEYGPAPQAIVPAHTGYNPAPQAIAPAHDGYSPAPQQYGPAPQQYGPAPQAIAPAHTRYSPAPQQFQGTSGYAPQDIVPGYGPAPQLPNVFVPEPSGYGPPQNQPYPNLPLPQYQQSGPLVYKPHLQAAYVEQQQDPAYQPRAPQQIVQGPSGYAPQGARHEEYPKDRVHITIVDEMKPQPQQHQIYSPDELGYRYDQYGRQYNLGHYPAPTPAPTEKPSGGNLYHYSGDSLQPRSSHSDQQLVVNEGVSKVQYVPVKVISFRPVPKNLVRKPGHRLVYNPVVVTKYQPMLTKDYKNVVVKGKEAGSIYGSDYQKEAQ